MKQQSFESQHDPVWQKLEAALGTSNASKIEDFPRLYRKVCHHLAVAKHRRYSPHLIDRLNHLVLGCHHRLYRHDRRSNKPFLRYVAYGFPQTLRNNSGFVWASLGLFLLPMLIALVACYLNDEIIYSIMSAEHVRNLESMYDPVASVLGRQRQADTDLMMFGFYIKNNIGISFQTFAGGILYGIGSVFFLIYNGILVGASAGHMAQVGFNQTFFPFVIGHSAFELTAIVLSGAAGLKLGFALVDPGQHSRLYALRLAGRDAIKIIYGSTIMLVIAAFLEAFWSSSSSLAPEIKYAVGSVLWLLVISYCVFAGRGGQNGS
jgi:uncharacterized membrane protein SpoIIM required for sporulation